MKHRTVLLAYIAMSILEIQAFAQTTTEPFGYNTDISPSAESWKMTQHGSLQPSLYTGTMTYELPLYTYSDNDFTIPIGLRYSYSGYRPNVHSGIIGLGWALNCGGVITREIRGLPDDYGPDQGERLGYWYAAVRDKIINNEKYTIRSGKIRALGRVEDSSLDKFEYDVFSDEAEYSRLHSDSYFSGPRYDPNPDLFHFSFLGQTGEFMLNPDGSVTCFNTSNPRGEYKVSLEINSTTSYKLTFLITITDGKGYEYVFGADKYSVEYNIMENADNDYAGDSDNITAVAWHLSKVTAPNGNSVEFVFNESLQRDVSVIRSFTSVINGGDYSAYQVQSAQTIYLGQATYYPLLDMILVNGTPVAEFEYEKPGWGDENSSDQFYLNNHSHCGIEIYGLNTDGNATKHLSGMTIRNSTGRTVERYDFEVTALGRRRTLLKSVSGLSFGKYSFDYSNAAVPTNDCEYVDHWGYWNGKGDAIYPYKYLANTDIRQSRLYSQFQDGYTGRDTDFQFTKAGALLRITYPEGGWSEIEYEQNSAGTLLNRELGTTPWADRNTAGFKPGGIRVKSISNYDNTDAPETTIEYEYLTNDGESSGMLMDMPRYAMSAHYWYNGIYFPVSEFHGTAFSCECTQSGGHDPEVVYSKVKEIYPDGSYIYYTYSVWDDHDGTSDIFLASTNEKMRYSKIPTDKSAWISLSLGGEDSVLDDRIRCLLLPAVTDNRSRRGLLLSKEEYDAEGFLTRKVENDYSCRTEMTQAMVFNTIVDFTKIDWSFTSTYPATTWETKYEKDGGSILTSHGCSYNELGQKSAESSHEVDKVEVHYQYLHEGTKKLPRCFISAVSKMAKTKHIGDKTYLLSLEELEYDMESTNPNPVRITIYSTAGPYDITGQKSMYEVPQNAESRSVSLKYDDKHRLVRVDLPDGAYREYTWDSTGRNITSKTVNDESNRWNYQWVDMIGLASVLDPSGQRESYEYDKNNRLSNVLNSDGEKTTAYRYHLKEE